MTPTDEDLLALAKIICTAMTGPSDFGWADQSDQYRAKCMDAALRAIVAERRALEVVETHVHLHQADLLSASERQAIRDRALDDAAKTANRYACEDMLRPAAGWSEEYADAWGVGVMDCALAISAAIRAMKGARG